MAFPIHILWKLPVAALLSLCFAPLDFAASTKEGERIGIWFRVLELKGWGAGFE